MTQPRDCVHGIRHVECHERREKDPVGAVRSVSENESQDTFVRPHEHYDEVSSCQGDQICFCVDRQEDLPPIYVVRGTQMYRLKWPQLPEADSSIVARPEIS